MKINTAVFCSLALITLLGFCFKEMVFPARAAEPTATRKKVCEPHAKLIVVKKGFIGTNDPTVKEFARICGITTILETKENPICCIRIEPLELDKSASG